MVNDGELHRADDDDRGDEARGEYDHDLYRFFGSPGSATTPFTLGASSLSAREVRPSAREDFVKMERESWAPDNTMARRPPRAR